MNLISLETGLPPQDDVAIKGAFEAFVSNTQKWADAAMKIVVTSEDDEVGMENAGKAEKALKELKREVEKTRKILKEESLRKGQAIDRIAKDIQAIIEPALKHSSEMAAFAETMEKKRKAELAAKRLELLRPFKVDTSTLDLENMPDDLFQITLAGIIKAAEEAEAARLKAEEEARKAAEAEAAERKRLQDEAAKAAKEKAAAEAAAKKAQQEAAAAQAAAKKAQEESAAQAAMADRARARQSKLLELGFRWQSNAFVMGTHVVTPQMLLEYTDQQLEKLIKVATAGDPDIRALHNYADMLIGIPHVSSDKAKEIVKAIRPGVQKIVDYLKSQQ